MTDRHRASAPQGSPRPALTMISAALIALGILLPSSPAGQVVVLTGIPILLGSTIIQMLGLRLNSLTTRWLVALASGVAGYTMIGGLIGWVGPHLGLDRPFDRWTMVVLWLLIVGAIVLRSVRTGRDSLRDLVPRPESLRLTDLALLLLLPLASLIGVWELNAHQRGIIAYVVCALAISLILAVVAGLTSWIRVPVPVQLGIAFLALVWQIPARGGSLFGIDIQAEWFFARQAISQASLPLTGTHNAYAGMLSVTAAPVQAHSLTGLHAVTYFQLIPGVFLALLIVAAFQAVRSFLPDRPSAFLIVMLAGGSSAFLHTIPTVPRQCPAMFSFGVLLLVLVERPEPIRRTRLLLIGLACAIAVQHYSTAYLAIGALVFGWLGGIIWERDRTQRLVSSVVATVSLGAVVVWDGIIANSQSGISTLLTSIRTQGLAFLPGDGSVLARWFKGAQTSAYATADVLRTLDLRWRAGLKVPIPTARGADATRLINDPPLGHVASLGLNGTTASSILGGVINQLLIITLLVALIYAVVRLGRSSRTPEIIGMAVFGIGLSAVSRLSGTIALQFSPERVRFQLYLVFVVVLAEVIARVRSRHPSWRLRWSPGVIVVSSGLAAFEMVLATSVTAPLTGGQENGALSSSAFDFNRSAMSPAYLATSRWVLGRAGPHSTVQMEPAAVAMVLATSGPDRKGVVPSIDPILISRFSWIVATEPNVIERRAQGTQYAKTAWFVFPGRFLGRHWNVVYASNTTAVYR